MEVLVTYVKTKKVKVSPQKKTVIIPKKIIVPIPVKKRIYIIIDSYLTV